ncbi:MAG: phosphatidylserine/phosphatidylglycerophosphate/cardiolipin synthase family protein [Candidatus Gracilibacteria bacterium]|nr:phosphatidylserine/phosphatidylglycerophosphate/cardiolipin synthase family protein [Candidatus Gracilibacteria bacterium]
MPIREKYITEPKVTKLIVDGEKARNAILSCIKDAKKTIRLRVFMWRDDESGRLILDALQKKMDSDQDIRVYIEKDIFGGKVYDFQKYLSIGKVGGDIFSTKLGTDFIKNNKNLNFSSIGTKSILFFKYLKENDHSKVFLFDENTTDTVAIIGGMNITDECLTAQNHDNPNRGGWHDYMVRIYGEATQKLIGKNGKRKRWIYKKIINYTEILLDIKTKRIIRKEIFKELKNAKKSVIVEHGYITDNKIVHELRKISFNGINVKIILPDRSDGVYHANMHSVEKLLKPSLFLRKRSSNLEVYLYSGMIHSKVILIDNEVAIMGSSNLTYNSFNILRETNAFFRKGNPVAKELGIQLKEDLKYTKRIYASDVPKYKKWLAIIEEIFI